MNTIKSFWVGWGVLCTAGGGAYYFAKQSINADRQSRWEAEQKRRRQQEDLESYNSMKPRSSIIKDKSPARTDFAGSPSQEMTTDPAPTSHAPANEGQRVREKSKYEASEPYRSKKGDRFS